MSKTIQETSIEAQIIRDRLLKAEIGDIIEYGELNRLTGLDIQKAYRSRLQTALKMARRENGFIFLTIRKIGIKRANDVEIVDSGRVGMEKGRRQFRRTAKVLTSVKEFDKLPFDKQIEHNTTLSLCAAVVQSTSKKSVTAVEQRVLESKKKLPLGQTLAAIIAG